jgi:copper homeostasis protein
VQKALEVIACSVIDATEAELGGANRVELVRALAMGGFTPDISIVRGVVEAVRIGVRVMIRESDAPTVSDEREFELIQEQARQFCRLPIEGLVAGFVRDGAIDVGRLERIVHLAPHRRITFHRAFEQVADPGESLRMLKHFPQVDRVLTRGCEGDASARRRCLEDLQELASPEITIVAAGGPEEKTLRALAESEVIRELHVGRAARVPAVHHGNVRHERVAAVREILDRADRPMART